MNTNSSNPYNLYVGQELIVAPARHSHKKQSYKITVESIGRKFANCEYSTRVYLKTLEIDGGQYSSPGKCFISEIEYANELEREHIWKQIQKATSDFSPTNHSLSVMKAVAFLLGIKPTLEGKMP